MIWLCIKFEILSLQYSGSYSFTAKTQRNKRQIINISGRKDLILYVVDNELIEVVAGLLILQNLMDLGCK